MSSQIEEIGFEYVRIDELPYYWRLKIEGFKRRSPACPWDGGALARSSEPIDHVQCLKCGRNYA